MEENLRRALAISRGELTTFVERPISAGMLAVALLVLLVAMFPNVRRRREEVFTAD
jgi:putative tricarboxylic transport membrane protein